jgi:hypothetical protein
MAILCHAARWLAAVFFLANLLQCEANRSGDSDESSYLFRERFFEAGRVTFASADGLHLLGEFDPGKPSIIYVHGWVREERRMPMFPNVAGWQAGGFNTFIYRWHHDALDLEECTFLGLRFECADQAEQRIWGARGFAGEKFIASYRAFFTQYPQYDREVRLVGRSLGAQMALYLSYGLVRNRDIALNVVVPQRIDLIDPYVSLASTVKGRLPEDSLLPMPPDLRSEGLCGNSNENTIYCVLENMAVFLRLHSEVRVITYGSFVSDLLASDFRWFTVYQQFSTGFMCNRAHESDRAECGPGDLLKNSSVVDAEHSLPLLSYMWSIDEAPVHPLAITGKTDTGRIEARQQWTVQNASGQWCRTAEGRTLLDIGALAFGHFGDEASLPAASGKELVKRLLDRGWPELDAEQCVAAISFENDVFERR